MKCPKPKRLFDQVLDTKLSSNSFEVILGVVKNFWGPLILSVMNKFFEGGTYDAPPPPPPPPPPPCASIGIQSRDKKAELFYII